MNTAGENYKYQDKLLTQFFRSETACNIFLDWLGVDKTEENDFLDALFGIFSSGFMTKGDFDMISKYLWDEDFEEKFRAFSSKYFNQLRVEGFDNPESLEVVASAIKLHVSTVLDKFDIYACIGNQDKFDENYVVLSKSIHGDLLISRDGERIYLFHNNTFFYCDRIVKDELGTGLFLLFCFPEYTIVIDMEENEIKKHQGKMVWERLLWDVNGIHLDNWDEERFIVLEARKSLVKPKNGLEDWKTQFLHLTRYGKDNADIGVVVLTRDVRVTGSHISNQVDVSEDEIRARIKCRINQGFYSVTGDEMIFDINWEIKDVVATKADSYLVYKQELFDADAKSRWYTSRSYWVFSIWERETLIEEIPEDWKPQFYNTRDNLFIICSHWNEKFIFSCKDECRIPIISIQSISEYQVHGEPEISIQYLSDTWEREVIDSTDNITMHEWWVQETERNYH